MLIPSAPVMVKQSLIWVIRTPRYISLSAETFFFSTNILIFKVGNVMKKVGEDYYKD